MVFFARAAAPPLPIARGDPLCSKAKLVTFKLRLGFFDIFILGSAGERAFFRVPLRKVSPSASCEGLMVVNLASASVGIIDSIATVGPLRRLVLTANVLVKGAPMAAKLETDLSSAFNLLMGSDAADDSSDASSGAPGHISEDLLHVASPAALPLLTKADLGSPVLDTI
jgi:hypothetical protein